MGSHVWVHVKDPKDLELLIALLKRLGVDYHTGTTVNMPQGSKVRAKAGFLKGTFVLSEDFDEPLMDFKAYME